MSTPAWMTYADFEPDPRLRSWIASYWQIDVSAHAEKEFHTVPPDGCISLAFRQGGAALLGPRVEALTPPAVPGAKLFGIRFRPGAGRSFLNLPRDLALRDRVLPIHDLKGLEWATDFGRALDSIAGDAERVAFADESLIEQSRRAAPPDPLVCWAVGLLIAADPAPSIAGVAARLGLSERHFRRRFLAAVELSPKELARIWRVRLCAGAALGHRESWAHHAADHGFADQSHLIREFRAVVGFSPEEFSREIGAIDHGRVWSPERAFDAKPPAS
jgi:AraC-like DNA-binding protein